jgi:hypothetical protein
MRPSSQITKNCNQEPHLPSPNPYYSTMLCSILSNLSLENEKLLRQAREKCLEEHGFVLVVKHPKIPGGNWSKPTAHDVEISLEIHRQVGLRDDQIFESTLRPESIWKCPEYVVDVICAPCCLHGVTYIAKPAEWDRKRQEEFKELYIEYGLRFCLFCTTLTIIQEQRQSSIKLQHD